MYNTKEIDIYSLNSMPLDQIVSLYQQGYKLSETCNICTGNIHKMNTSIRSIAATCNVTTKQAGQTVTLSATPSGGTAPYTVDFRKDGVLIPGGQKTGVAEGQTATFTYITTTTDAGKTIRFSSIARDSCPTTPKTSPEESCNIAVQTTPPPPPQTYSCINNVCQPSTCTPGSANCYEVSNCNNQCTAPPPPPPPPSGACTPACTVDQYCIMGTCVPKTYVTYGAIGIGALFLISIVK